MSRMWIERPIASVEDAEALPEGTVVRIEDKDGPWEKRPDGQFQGADRIIVDASWVLDRIALVPVDATVEELPVVTPLDGDA